MDIDFSKQIIKQKERDTLYKPFPTASGFALFAKIDGELVKVLFSNKEMVEVYLDELGYDWGPKKNEYTNFDNIARLLKRYPDLANAREVIAADPQHLEKEGATEIESQEILYRGRLWKVAPTSSSQQNMDGHPSVVELREVDHLQAKKKKLPPWMDKDKKEDKKGDKKSGKKGDKKDDKEGDKKEKGKNGKKLPPWLNKKKSKAKNYSKLWRKVKKISEDKEE